MIHNRLLTVSKIGNAINASRVGIMLRRQQCFKAKCRNNERRWCSAYYSYSAYFQH